jgi:CRP-like cAMP-binding protein
MGSSQTLVVPGNLALTVSQNHLIDSLTQIDRTRLVKVCDVVPLNLAHVLDEVNQVERHVYFPSSGFISMLALLDGHTGVEVGMVGREGMVGGHTVLGVAVSPWQALVQGTGQAWRLDTTEFVAQVARSTSLRRCVSRYLYVLMAQQAGAAACIRFHQIGPRLARWLLMSQDRAQADLFHITHEFLSYMLGVRRVGITAAAGALQQLGLIEYHRGELKVIDRAGLEAQACTCYAADKALYAKWMGHSIH